jgi:hypothetical protein
MQFQLTAQRTNSDHSEPMAKIEGTENDALRQAMTMTFGLYGLTGKPHKVTVRDYEGFTTHRYYVTAITADNVKVVDAQTLKPVRDLNALYA